MSNNNQNIDQFVKRLNRTIESANGLNQMKAIGEFMIEKVRVRTRLGYGVDQHLAEKSKLKPLSKDYIDYRKKLASGNFKERKKPLKNPRPVLWDKRIVKKSALTLTGSMLDSLKIKSMSKKGVRIGPTENDMFGVSNSSKAYWQEKVGRIFLRLSFQEVKQIRIFWLRNFKMLLKGKNFV